MWNQVERLSGMRSLCGAAAAFAVATALVFSPAISVTSVAQGNPGGQVLAAGEGAQDDPDEGGQ